MRERTKQLAESEDRYRSFVQNFHGIAWRGDVNFKSEFFQGDVEKITGYKEEDFVSGKIKWLRIIHPDDLPKYLESAEKIRTVPNFTDEREFRIISRDGQVRWIHAIVQNECDSFGKPLKAQGILYDITKRKKLEEELDKTKQLATIVLTAGMVGHDLNNPLQVITNLNYLLGLKIDAAPVEVKEYAEAQGVQKIRETLSEQIKYMDKIVSDLKDYAAPIKIEISKIQTRQLLDDVIKIVTIPDNVEVSIKINDDLRQFEADVFIMKRVLYNLILNAVQAMPKGGKLAIEASRKNYSVVISVSDTGLGIPEENLKKIFTPHFTTKAKGTGLGLSVCKRMIETHGGTITFESQPGKGTTFTIKIPQQQSKEITAG